MSLAWNIRWLLDPNQGEDPSERLAVEYHLLSWRELYDKSFITSDRHSYGEGDCLIRGGPGFFKVTDITYPHDACPRRLCLSFDSPADTARYNLPGRPARIHGPPIETVSLDFTALLSVFARGPLVPLGLRRVGNKPVYQLPLSTFPPPSQDLSRLRPLGIDSPGFVAILRGLGRAPDDLVNAVMAAAKLYHVGLSVLALDTAVAYVSLVSAIECLAAYHYRSKGPMAKFEDVQRLDLLRHLLDQLPAIPEVEELVPQIKEALLNLERFLTKKFVHFLSEFAPPSLWDTPDPLYDDPSPIPPITRDNFEGCLREVYRHRSDYLHGGAPFPAHAIVGLHDRLPIEVTLQYLDLDAKHKYLPPFVWFERLVQLAMVEYLRVSFAPHDAPREQDGRQ